MEKTDGGCKEVMLEKKERCRMADNRKSEGECPISNKEFPISKEKK